MKIVIAGAGGFLGSALAGFLKGKGHEVRALSRHELADKLEGADVLINLCGESLFGRWTKRKKKRIISSRIDSTRQLCHTIATMSNGPTLYIGASAVGIYGSGFLAELCQQWEKISDELLSIRIVHARLGVVLSKEGGALKKMISLFKMGLGAVIGDGKQMINWIALDDVLNGFLFVIENPIVGAVDFVSPQPVSNREFTSLLAKALHRFALCRCPAFLVKLLMGEGASLLLTSSCATPAKLLSSGYSFRFSSLQKWLQINL